jgi:hypothetical protein
MFCAPCYIAKAEDCQRGLACVTRLTPGEVLEVCRRMLAVGVAMHAESATISP